MGKKHVHVDKRISFKFPILINGNWVSSIHEIEGTLVSKGTEFFKGPHYFFKTAEGAQIMVPVDNVAGIEEIPND